MCTFRKSRVKFRKGIPTKLSVKDLLQEFKEKNQIPDYIGIQFTIGYARSGVMGYHDSSILERIPDLRRFFLYRDIILDQDTAPTADGPGYFRIFQRPRVKCTCGNDVSPCGFCSGHQPLFKNNKKDAYE